MHETDVARHSFLVDPHLHVWGWEIPAYLFLGGLAAGLMILTSALWTVREERSAAARWLPFAVPVLVSLGMAALFLDLSHRLHVWRFYLAFRWTSPMSWGAWILVLVYPVSIATAIAGLDAQQADRLVAGCGRLGLGGLAGALRSWGGARGRPLRFANAIAGVALGVYTGVLLSTLGARAFWSSALLGPLFLVSGISTAAALALLLPISEEEHHLVATWDRLAMGVELAMLLLFLAGLATGGADARAAATLVLGGPFTAPFWTLVVIAGLAVPALLGSVEARLRLPRAIAGPVLVLVGGFALRWIVVAAGQG
jgi:formate-dependent nitrite reductase membrane component NrfD